MKRIVCFLFYVLGSIFTAFWIGAYLIHYSMKAISGFVTIMMWVSAILISLSLMIGVVYIKISVDQWFVDGDGDRMALKDRIWVGMLFLINVVCICIFVVTIIKNNSTAAEVTELDNMKLRFLLLVIANSWMSFAYYQHYQVLK